MNYDVKHLLHEHHLSIVTICTHLVQLELSEEGATSPRHQIKEGLLQELEDAQPQFHDPAEEEDY